LKINSETPALLIAKFWLNYCGNWFVVEVINMKLSSFAFGFVSILLIVIVAISLSDSFCPDTEWGKILGTVVATMLAVGVTICLIWRLLQASISKLLGRE